MGKMFLDSRAILIVASSLLAASSQGIPLGMNITTSDRVHTGSGWYGNHEDQETEPGTIATQTWDLEGFYLRGSKLTMVGGFDFRNGVSHGGHLYRSGDIFVDVNGDALYGPPAEGTGFGNGTVANAFGYDYAIRLNFGAMTYSVFQLTPSSTVSTTIGESINQESNPWRYDQGGTLLAGYENLSMGYYGNLNDADVGGLLGGTHHALSVDLSFAAGQDIVTHFTMSCGNDNLMGAAHVPETGATVLYLLCGVAIVFIARQMLSVPGVRTSPVLAKNRDRTLK